MKLLSFIPFVAAALAGVDPVLSTAKHHAHQEAVIWDQHSLSINGERVFVFSGEFHPFRLPVPSLYSDVFHKIKALGFNAVSFNVFWPLLEGRPGTIYDEGIFDIDLFFDAAVEAGMYLVARPGPHIDADVSGGGFPGWLQRVKGTLRTDAADFLAATSSYMENVLRKIALAQITNGGPVILYQPENEYTTGEGGVAFPNHRYLQYLIDQARQAGIVVPLINNDAGLAGIGSPSADGGLGSVDIYGRNVFPVGRDCSSPQVWPKDGLALTSHQRHLATSPTTPLSLVEFQGGALDLSGSHGPEQCSILTNHEYIRVFYKNNIAAGVKLFNVYMIFGGTNWGNIGGPGSQTSYDYGACIREDRAIDREKYSELKLQAQFIKVSPGYLLTTPLAPTQGVYSNNTDVTVTPLVAKQQGHFFVVRHTDFSTTRSASYTIKLPTSAGAITIPQMGGSLSLHRRDSKIHVTDYPVGDHKLLYSTAEIFTWKKFGGKTVVIMYGGPHEVHEFALVGLVGKKAEARWNILEGEGVEVQRVTDLMVAVQWRTSDARAVVQFGQLYFYLVDRNTAYNYWVPTLSGKGQHPAYGSSLMNPDAVIVNGGYLVRSAFFEGKTLYLKADFNASTSLEIIGAPKEATMLSINGARVFPTRNDLGNWVVKKLEMKFPEPYLPDLSRLEWHGVNSLPEILKDYNDSLWPVAYLTTSNNSREPLKTPVSLYGSDYGFHSGTLVFRGYFTAPSTSLALSLITQGGLAFADSIWLNGTHIGSFKGSRDASTHASVHMLKHLIEGQTYVLTVLVDNSGLNANSLIGPDFMKKPRGILNYKLTHDGKEVPISPWKLTGNLGGEQYRDHFRGPLNEGGLYFERQGYHLPAPVLGSSFQPASPFKPVSPFQGIHQAGVFFYTAMLNLHLPAHEYDIPLSFVFENTTTNMGPYRALLYVNGFQFGKYISHLDPQTEFHVPEGILDYSGDNWIGVSLWALEDSGARIAGLRLKHGSPVSTGRARVDVVKGPKYRRRYRAY